MPRSYLVCRKDELQDGDRRVVSCDGTEVGVFNVDGQFVAWQSCEGSDVDHWGVVRFVAAPGGRGTQVTIELEYEPMGGAFGVTVAKLSSEEPGQEIREDLRRFKQYMETGDILTTEGQPRGRGR